MQEVQMFLDDPQKSVILGVPGDAPAHRPQNAFYEATELDRIGKRAEAERIYLELLNQDFDNVALFGALGMNYAVAEKSGLAFSLLKQAYDNIDELLPAFKRLGITPKPGAASQLAMADFTTTKKSELLNAMGTCYKHENNTVKAREYFQKAQELIPLNPDIQNNLGTLYINEGNPEDALKHLNAALSVDPEHPQSHWNRSLARLELGDYAQGWPEYDYGLVAHVRAERGYTKQNEPGLPYWKGEPDAHVVVYGEQGIGDEIMFASMIPDLMRSCKSVVFECHRKLHKLFANSFPGLDMYPTREDDMVAWPLKSDGTPRYAFTHKIAIGSIGQFFRNSLDAFPGTPYLSPTSESELHWAEELAKLPPGPKVGISWMGGHKKTRIEVRSVQLEQMLPILKHKGIQFISLQYTPHEDQLADFEAKHGIKIHQFPEACYSGVYDDTAGLVANLDLVITVCTSLVHLAGSMGVPTWVMTPSRPAWRYRLDLDGMPWYNCVTLFRQAQGTTAWEPVIDEVAASLEKLLTPLEQENEIQVA
jgi:Tetratricopeptide repeat